ncbi:MAG: lytic murein transglycosylase B [Nitrospirota bacterium]|nr:lytic murein transglycosylase B [Nitrospirota bacterium]
MKNAVKRRERRFFFTLVLLLAGYGAGFCGDFTGNPRMESFVRMMADTQGADPEELRGILEQARKKQSIIRAMEAPAEAKPWWAYKPILVNARNVQEGRAFLKRHVRALKRAESIYGVPGALITAILGVETRYGKNMGTFRVLDSLATLAFDYPRRADFFANELKEFFLMAKDDGLAPLSLKGSYAGAMGYPQFMPSSFRRYAVDFDKDGKKDIWNSVEDAIGSVGNYLASFGYNPTQPVCLRAVPGPSESALKDKVLANGVEPAFSFVMLKDAGFEFQHDGLDANTTGGVFSLEGLEGPEYWVALPNFWVITQYNKSRLYAMAVFELARNIQGAKGWTIPMLSKQYPR